MSTSSLLFTAIHNEHFLTDDFPNLLKVISTHPSILSDNLRALISKENTLIDNPHQALEEMRSFYEKYRAQILDKKDPRLQKIVDRIFQSNSLNTQTLNSFPINPITVAVNSSLFLEYLSSEEANRNIDDVLQEMQKVSLEDVPPALIWEVVLSWHTGNSLNLNFDTVWTYIKIANALVAIDTKRACEKWLAQQLGSLSLSDCIDLLILAEKTQCDHLEQALCIRLSFNLLKPASFYPLKQEYHLSAFIDYLERKFPKYGDAIARYISFKMSGAEKGGEFSRTILGASSDYLRDLLEVVNFLSDEKTKMCIEDVLVRIEQQKCSSISEMFSSLHYAKKNDCKRLAANIIDRLSQFLLIVDANTQGESKPLRALFIEALSCDFTDILDTLNQFLGRCDLTTTPPTPELVLTDANAWDLLRIASYFNLNRFKAILPEDLQNLEQRASTQILFGLGSLSWQELIEAFYRADSLCSSSPLAPNSFQNSLPWNIYQRCVQILLTNPSQSSIGYRDIFFARLNDLLVIHQNALSSYYLPLNLRHPFAESTIAHLRVEYPKIRSLNLARGQLTKNMQKDLKRFSDLSSLSLESVESLADRLPSILSASIIELRLQEFDPQPSLFRAIHKKCPFLQILSLRGATNKFNRILPLRFDFPRLREIRLYSNSPHFLSKLLDGLQKNSKDLKILIISLTELESIPSFSPYKTLFSRLDTLIIDTGYESKADDVIERLLSTVPSLVIKKAKAPISY